MMWHFNFHLAIATRVVCICSSLFGKAEPLWLFSCGTISPFLRVDFLAFIDPLAEYIYFLGEVKDARLVIYLADAAL